MTDRQTLDASRRRWTRRTWFRAFFGGSLGTAGYALGWEPRRVRVVPLRLSDRPKVKFAYFTDLHFKGRPALVDQVIEIIHRSSVPFAVFGGDLLEDRAHLPVLLERLGQLRVPLYGVPGNHDYWSGEDFGEVGRAFAATGGGWLLDEVVTPPGTDLDLAGHSCSGGTVLSPARGRRTVALVHYPAWVDRLPAGYELVLAGHSHGGQVRLPFVGSLITPYGVGAYDWGRYSTTAGPLYVSSGVGTYLIGARFLCPPEVVMVEV